MKIMIVDDNRKIRDVIKSVLFEQKADILECENAKSAIENYDRFRPDWVLMDIEMDGMDGIAAAKAIVKADTDAKVVIVTNYDEPHFRFAARAAGAVAFVNKENLSELNEIINAGRGAGILRS